MAEAVDANLVLLRKKGAHKVFSIPSNVTVIGRRRDCDLRIPLASVSKRHCQVNHSDKSWEVRDLGSRNGTFLNNKRIEQTPVSAGDYLRIGPLTFVIQLGGQPEQILMPKSTKPQPGKARKPKPQRIDEAQTETLPEMNQEGDLGDLDLSDSFLDGLSDDDSSLGEIEV